MFWPGTTREITDTVTRSRKCTYWHINNQKTPIIPHEVPLLVRGKNSKQFCVIKLHNYLCVVNYYFKFPVNSLVPSRTATSVIIHLKSIFGRHGIPKELVAEKMLFASREL